MTARQFEMLTDAAASTCLGGAAAFAAYAGLSPSLGQPLAIAGAAGAAAFAFWLSRRFLASVSRSAPRSASPAQADELLLDDRVSGTNPGSQVVRLFDPASTNPAWAGPADAMPSSVSPDASQALHDALNRLRRSLR